MILRGGPIELFFVYCLFVVVVVIVVVVVVVVCLFVCLFVCFFVGFVLKEGIVSIPDS